MKSNVNVSGGFRTEAEQNEPLINEKCFYSNPGTWAQKMENFPKYVHRAKLTRFCALYEIFKKAVPVKGSVVECGVNQGFGLMTWAKLSSILEPVNLTRRIYGFDSFEGFPSVSEQDKSQYSDHIKQGDLAANAKEELEELVRAYDSSRFLGHIDKVKLVKGDATKTIPSFIEENPHVMVSLLFMDFDLYEPTKVALEHFLPRMPKGAIIAFDELDNPLWPGETQAMLEITKQHKLRIQRLDFDPYIGFAVIE